MRSLPGINIQWPWSQLLINGEKTIETRGYPLPKKYQGAELALIETPGPRGKREAQIEKARIIGTIIFSESFRYDDSESWAADQSKHLVDVCHPQFAFDPAHEKWAWVVQEVKKLKHFVTPPQPRGIVFASQCLIGPL